MTDKRIRRSREFVLAEIGLLALLGTALALPGAFGTGDLPLVLRLAYWMLGLVLAWAAMHGILFLTRASARLLGLPGVAAYLLAIPLLSAGIAFVVAGLRGDTGAITLSLFAQTSALGLAIFAMFWLLYARLSMRHATPEKEHAPPSPPEPEGLLGTALHRRLPADFGPILALVVEDHYVTVIGNDQREMLLINLTEASEEIGSDKGLRIHRSWWVAKPAVRELRRSGRKLFALLHNGEEAPVSRANVARAKALWGPPTPAN